MIYGATVLLSEADLMLQVKASVSFTLSKGKSEETKDRVFKFKAKDLADLRGWEAAIVGAKNACENPTASAAVIGGHTAPPVAAPSPVVTSTPTVAAVPPPRPTVAPLSLQTPNSPTMTHSPQVPPPQVAAPSSPRPSPRGPPLGPAPEPMPRLDLAKQNAATAASTAPPPAAGSAKTSPRPPPRKEKVEGEVTSPKPSPRGFKLEGIDAAAKTVQARQEEESSSSAPPAKPVPSPRRDNSATVSAAVEPEEVRSLYNSLVALQKKFSEASDDKLLDDGYGESIYASLAQLRDIMLPLHTKYKVEGYMNPSVALWRSMNEDVPKRINALKLQRKKDLAAILEETPSEIEFVEKAAVNQQALPVVVADKDFSESSESTDIELPDNPTEEELRLFEQIKKKKKQQAASKRGTAPPQPPPGPAPDWSDDDTE